MTRSADRISLLETFIRIAERGSVTAAARDLEISQGSASRQLKDLETRLGVQLARRTTHSLSLTEAGEEVLADARDLLARWEALSERQSAARERIAGPLSVVAPVALGQTHLADAAIAFQREHPEVSLTWRLDDAPIRFAEIGCDCWIRVGPVPDETLVLRRLGSVERMLVGAPAIRGEDAPPFISLTPYEGADVTLTAESGATRRVAVRLAMAVDNIMAVKRAALCGVGAAIMPRWLIAEELAAGALVDLAPGWRAPTLDVGIAYQPTRTPPLRLTAFIGAVEAHMRKIDGILA